MKFILFIKFYNDFGANINYTSTIRRQQEKFCDWKLRTARIIEDTEEREFRIIDKNCLYLSYYFQGGRQGLNRESRYQIVNMRTIACSDLNFQWWL